MRLLRDQLCERLIMQYFDGHLEKVHQSQQPGELQIVGRQCIRYGTREECEFVPSPPPDLGNPDPFVGPTDGMWFIDPPCYDDLISGERLC